jgi:hypothetical protein
MRPSPLPAVRTAASRRSAGVSRLRGRSGRQRCPSVARPWRCRHGAPRAAGRSITTMRRRTADVTHVAYPAVGGLGPNHAGTGRGAKPIARGRRDMPKCDGPTRNTRCEGLAQSCQPRSRRHGDSSWSPGRGPKVRESKRSALLRYQENERDARGRRDEGRRCGSRRGRRYCAIRKTSGMLAAAGTRADPQNTTHGYLRFRAWFLEHQCAVSSAELPISGSAGTPD